MAWMASMAKAVRRRRVVRAIWLIVLALIGLDSAWFRWRRLHLEIGGQGFTVDVGSAPVLIRHGANGVDGVDGEGCTAQAGGQGYMVNCPGADPVLIRHGTMA